MAVPESIKKLWIDIQKKHSEPVNAIGVPIDPRDIATMKVWIDEGIAQFLKVPDMSPTKPPESTPPSAPQEPT